METVQKGWVTLNPPGQQLSGQGPSRSSILCPWHRGGGGSVRTSQPPPSQADAGDQDALQALRPDPAGLTAMDAGTAPGVRGLDLHARAFTYETLPASISAAASTSLGR